MIRIAPFSNVGSSSVVLMTMDTISIGPITPVPTIKVVLSRSSSRMRCPEQETHHLFQNVHKRLNQKHLGVGEGDSQFRVDISVSSKTLLTSGLIHV